MAKKQNNEPETKSSPIIRHLISTGFDLLKHFLRDFENTRKIKKIDKMDEQFKTIENLLVKHETMLQENRRLIEELKNRVLISDLVIILLSITILIQLIR